jgi:hypothetical protein
MRWLQGPFYVWRREALHLFDDRFSKFPSRVSISKEVLDLLFTLFASMALLERLVRVATFVIKSLLLLWFLYQLFYDIIDYSASYTVDCRGSATSIGKT